MSYNKELIDPKSLPDRLRAQATWVEEVNYGRPTAVMLEAADALERIVLADSKVIDILQAQIIYLEEKITEQIVTRGGSPVGAYEQRGTEGTR